MARCLGDLVLTRPAEPPACPGLLAPRTQAGGNEPVLPGQLVGGMRFPVGRSSILRLLRVPTLGFPAGQVIATPPENFIATQASPADLAGLAFDPGPGASPDPLAVLPPVKATQRRGPPIIRSVTEDT